MYSCKKHNTGGNPLRHSLCVLRCAQLITDKDLRVHAAQRHGNALRLGAAGIDIAADLCGTGQAAGLTGHQLAALVNDADEGVTLTKPLYDRPQQCCFAAARRAGQQQSPGPGGHSLLQRGRQWAGDPARDAQIQRGHGRKTARPPAACHTDAAAALHGEIALLQLVLVCVDRTAAKLQKAVPQHVRLHCSGKPCTRQEFYSGAQPPTDRKLYRLSQTQTNLLYMRCAAGIQPAKRCAQRRRKAFKDAVILVHRFFTSHCHCMPAYGRIEPGRHRIKKQDIPHWDALQGNGV